MGLMVGGCINWQVVAEEFIDGLKGGDNESRWLKVKGARDMLCGAQLQYDSEDVKAAAKMLWHELARLETAIPISRERRKELICQVPISVRRR